MVKQHTIQTSDSVSLCSIVKAMQGSARCSLPKHNRILLSFKTDTVRLPVSSQPAMERMQAEERETKHMDKGRSE